MPKRKHKKRLRKEDFTVYTGQPKSTVLQTRETIPKSHREKLLKKASRAAKKAAYGAGAVLSLPFLGLAALAKKAKQGTEHLLGKKTERNALPYYHPAVGGHPSEMKAEKKNRPKTTPKAQERPQRKKKKRMPTRPQRPVRRRREERIPELQMDFQMPETKRENNRLEGLLEKGKQAYQAFKEKQKEKQAEKRERERQKALYQAMAAELQAQQTKQAEGKASEEPKKPASKEPKKIEKEQAPERELKKEKRPKQETKPKKQETEKEIKQEAKEKAAEKKEQIKQPEQPIEKKPAKQKKKKIEKKPKDKAQPKTQDPKKKRNKWLGIAAAVLLLLGGAGWGGWYYFEGRYVYLSVDDNGNTVQIRTAARNVEQMLAEAGIALAPEDEMDTPRDTALADEMVIHITRAKTITIDTGDGKQVQTLLAKGTVQQALDKAGVKLGTADEVDTSLDTAVVDEMIIHIIRAKTVTIDTGDGKQAKALLAKGTVQQALDKAGVKLGTEDAIDTPLDTVIKGDMAVKITRAKKIQIKAKAGDKTVMLATGTVKDALDKSGLTYDTEDEISPSLETKISDGMTIKLVRLNTKVHTRTVKIAFQTIQKKSNRVERGTTDVSQKGQEGVRTIKEKVVYKDGKEVKRVEISNEVTKQPVNKIVLIGTGPPMNPAIKGLPETPTSKMIIRKVTVDQITAYTHTGRRTATGKWPKVGMCAVNRRIFPYGTMFYVPGYGYAVAEDTGANNSSKVSIDLFMDTKEDCLRWGRKRNVTVTIVRRP